MLFTGQFVYIAISLVAYRLIHGRRWSFSCALLKGLKQYELDHTTSKPSLEKRSQRRREIGFGERRKILQIELGDSAIQQTVFYHSFDTLVCLLSLTAIHGLVYFFFPFISTAPNNFCTPLSVLTYFAALGLIMKVDIISRYTSRFEKWCSLTVFGISFVLCLSLLSCLPHHILLFNRRELSTDLSHQLSSFLAKISTQSRLEIPMEIELNAIMVSLGLSLVASLFASMLCQPAIRTTRSLHVLLNPPQHLENYFTLALPLYLLKHFQDAILLANCTLLVNPLVEHLQLDISSLRRAQAVGLLLWSLCQFCLFRSIIQGYLCGGLIHWFDTVQTNEELSDHESTTVALTVHRYSFLLSKVALQIMTPVVCFGSCAMLIFIGTRIENESLVLLFGFCGWWGSLCWLIYSIVVIGMFRTAFLNIK